MSRDTFRRVQRGDRLIPASAINAPQEAVEDLQGFSGPGAGLDFGKPSVPQWTRPYFLAVITHADIFPPYFVPTVYSWSRMTDTVTDPVSRGLKIPEDGWPDPVQGGPYYEPILGLNGAIVGYTYPCHTPPAFEVNNFGVPVGSVVTMHVSENGECLWFHWYPPFGQGWGGIDSQGGLLTSPVPPPTDGKATSVRGGNPGNPSRPYTYTLTSQPTYGGPFAFPADKATESNPSLPFGVTNQNPLDGQDYNVITFTTVPGVTQYGLYQLTPGPPGLVQTITATPGSGTVTANVTSNLGDPTKPPPTTNTTSSITTPQLYANQVTGSQVSTPGTPTVTATNPGPTYTGAYTVTANTPGGSTTATATATGTSSQLPSPTNPYHVTWPNPVGVSPGLQQSVTYTVYRTFPDNTGLATGPIGTAGPFGTGVTPSFLDTGLAVVPGMAANPSATNTTGLSSFPALTGALLTQLQTPGAPSVSPLTTGSTTYAYGITASDATGSTPLSPTTSISNGQDGGPNNAIDWSPVAGALTYGVWRTVGGASQGQIGTVTAGSALTFTDGGAAGSGTAPTTNSTGGLSLPSTGQTGAPTTTPPAGQYPIENQSGVLWLWTGAAWVQLSGGVTSVTGTAPISVSPTTGAAVVTHNTSGVSAGTYTSATVTVDANGHVTSASSGAGGGGNASNTLTEYTGTATTTLTQIFDLLKSHGVHGSVSLKNTGALSVNWQAVATSADGTVNTGSLAALGAGARTSANFESTSLVGSTTYPYTEVVLKLQTPSGTTTYDIWESDVD